MKRACLGAIVFLVTSCLGEPPPDEVAEPASIAAAPSRFVEVRRPADMSILEAPAVAHASADAYGEVTPPALLRIARVHVQVGQPVSANDPIVDAYAPELLDAAATYLSAASRARAHDERADQLEALLQEGLVRRTQVFEQRARAADLRAERYRAVAVLRSSGVDPKEAAALLERGFVTLVAPTNGIVTELSARVGRSYQPGAAPIARILGEAEARIEVRTARPWPAASSVVFRTSDGRDIALKPIPVATVVVPADGTSRSWFEPEENLSLPDGLVGTARVFAAEDLWEVPAAAIRQRGDDSEVVRQRDGRGVVVEVDVATASGASALVRGPFRSGDRVAGRFPSDEPVEPSP
jgi:hypothetical protein